MGNRLRIHKNNLNYQFPKVNFVYPKSKAIYLHLKVFLLLKPASYAMPKIVKWQYAGSFNLCRVC